MYWRLLCKVFGHHGVIDVVQDKAVCLRCDLRWTGTRDWLRRRDEFVPLAFCEMTL